MDHHDKEPGPTSLHESSRLLEILPADWKADDIWAALFETAPLAYALFDLHSEQVVPNQKCYDLFGIERRAFGWIDRGKFGHPDDEAATADMHRRVLAGEVEGFELDKRYIDPDGSVLWGHLVGSVLHDREDRPWALLISIENITSRVMAEARLRESESRFRSLIQHATDAIIVVDADASLLYASPSAKRLVGVPGDEFLGSNVLDLIHPDDHLVAAQTFGVTVLEPGVHVPLRMRVRRPDGSLRYVEVVSTNLLDDPAVNGIVINVRDLTDAEQVASALEMTENRYRRMLENISDTVTLIDANAHVLLSTGHLRSIMGYPTEFWADRNAFDIVHPDDLDRMGVLFVELLESRANEMSDEVRIRTSLGTWIDAEITGINLLDDPDVAAIVLTTRNVTTQKRYERELAEARDQAVKALRMRTEFIASVSHELRTPIHGILGLSELLATADLDAEARNLARSIGRATESLRMVLDDILDFSKIEVGRLEVNTAPMDAIELTEDLAALFGPQARAKGISLLREVGPGFPKWIMGDGLRLRQVLSNLIGNAIKFTAEGGVELFVERRPAGPDGREWVRFSVVDSGIGIPSDAHDRLFEPFSQVHGATTREFGGTGLGLSIAKRLVELMGGELGFESTLGEGSTFWFALPLIDLEGAESASIESAIERRELCTTGGVLVVEDNPINQLLVRRQLERLGYDAVVVDNGVAALELFPDSGVAVVLMDWQLPGIDGLETTRRLRLFEAEHHLVPTPVIAMTASALPGDRERCIDAGMDDFIAKPVSMSALGDMVHRWSRPASTQDGDNVGTTGPGSRPDPVDDLVADLRGGPAERESLDGDESGVSEPSMESVSSFDSASAIDVPTLDHLVDELADPMLVVTVVRTYLRELDGRIAAISAAIEAKDRSSLASSAHTLGSTSAAVGAASLAERCLELEQFARVPSPAALIVSGAELRARADAVVVGLGDQIRRLERDYAGENLPDRSS